MDDVRSRAVDLDALRARLGDFAEGHLLLDRNDLKALLGTLVMGVAVEGGHQPERQKAPVGTGASEAQIPTKCLKVNTGVAGSPTGSVALAELRLVGTSETSGSPEGEPPGYITSRPSRSPRRWSSASDDWAQAVWRAMRLGGL